MYLWYVLKELVSVLQRSDARQLRRLRLIATAAGLIAIWLIWSSVSWLLWSRPTTYRLGGTVAFQGVPIEDGKISFEPQSGEDAQLRVATISKGTFSLPSAQGVRRNKKYTVRVQGFRNTGQKYENNDPEQSGDIYEQYIPSQFNSQSSIVITTDRSTLWSGVTLDLR